MTEYTELRDIDDELFKCKVLWQHDMDTNPSPQHIDGDVARLAFRIVALRCTRCGRERYIYLDSQGRKIGNYYKWPEQYPKMHRYSGDELWAEAIRRDHALLSAYNGKGGLTRSKSTSTRRRRS